MQRFHQSRCCCWCLLSAACCCLLHLQEYCDCGTLSSWVGNTLMDPADNEQVLQLLLLLQVRGMVRHSPSSMN
jgi:hypothetical protein